MSELKGIFSGEIKKWSQIKGSSPAGEDSEIVVLGREASSGTGEYLRDHILAGKEFGAAVKLMPSSQAVIDAVEKQANAVGFVGMSQAEKAGDRVKVVTVKLNQSSPDSAKEDNLTGQDYPLDRPLYLYFNAAGADLTKSFVQFCQSEGGQKIVKDMGFMAVR